MKQTRKYLPEEKFLNIDNIRVLMNFKNNLFSCLLIVVMNFSGCRSDQSARLDATSRNISSVAENQVELVRNDKDRKVDVMINGTHFTSYLYPEDLKKPVLYPIKTANGTIITRGYPIEPRPGERVDHPHHVGLWFNYGDVNGLDFWNNSDAIPENKRSNYGTILHKEIKNIHTSSDMGQLDVTMEWVGPGGEKILQENTSFIFKGKGNQRLIDRITTLKALENDVFLKDNKEGVLGLRVARELEHPSENPEIFTDASGKPTDVPIMNNEGVTGNYRSSEGTEGNEVWATRANWMILSGQINDEHISVAILDHKDNVGFPTYWHARGYGLFAANPLGQKAFSDGKEELNFKLSAGESVTFKHRIIVNSGEKVPDEQLNNEYNNFIRTNF
jgi:hypothetical protein